MKKKIKNILNIIAGVLIFLLLIGSAFAVSFIFGMFFVVGFALAIYKGDLKKKPLKPAAIFLGALVVRVALFESQKIFASETLPDLIVSVLMFIAIFLLGWKIKKS